MDRTERFEQTPLREPGESGTLVAYSRDRILRIRVVGRGLEDAAKRRAASRRARLGFRRLSGSAS